MYYGFYNHVNEKFDLQQQEIKEIREEISIIPNHTSQLKNLWSKYNEQLKEKDFLKDEGTKTLIELKEEIHDLDKRVSKVEK